MTLTIYLYIQVTSEHCSIRLLLENRLVSISIQDNMSGVY